VASVPKSRPASRRAAGFRPLPLPSSEKIGDPAEIRTRDLLFRKQPLYPAELRGRDGRQTTPERRQGIACLRLDSGAFADAKVWCDLGLQRGLQLAEDQAALLVGDALHRGDHGGAVEVP
jgi:hypothetical protein